MREGAENGTVLDRIVARRRERVRAEGPGLSAGGSAAGGIPAERPEELGAPVPFLRAPAVITEIKRASPSRGVIKGGVDPVEQARLYAEQGAKSLSVLTEEDHFGGSLADLTAVKRAFPDLAVLRKDFLLSVEDVEVSWRAGADAVLLIAEVLSAGELAAMHRRAGELGMAALVELHDPEDVEKAAGLGQAGQAGPAGHAGHAGPSGPALVGINSRDLRSFRIDLLHPFEIRRQIRRRLRRRSAVRGRPAVRRGG